jgi:uncharacterized protein (TIGR02265 family)
MADTLALMLRRRDTCPPSAAGMGVYFSSVLSCARTHLGDAAADQLVRDGLVPRRMVALFKYPTPDLLRLMTVTVEALLRSGMSEADALIALGHSVAVHYLGDTPMGKLLIQVNGKNPHRVLSNVPTIYATVCIYGAPRYTKTGDRSAEMEFKGEWLGSTMCQGVFQMGIKLSTDLDATVRVDRESADCTDFTLALSW